MYKPHQKRWTTAPEAPYRRDNPNEYSREITPPINERRALVLDDGVDVGDGKLQARKGLRCGCRAPEGWFLVACRAVVPLREPRTDLQLVPTRFAGQELAALAALG